MTSFRLVLVLLCLGLMGALPFVLSLPKPERPGDARLAMLEVPRSGYALREAVHLPIRQALNMANAGNHAQALILVESLSALPDQTIWERQTIDHVRASMLAQVQRLSR